MHVPPDQIIDMMRRETSGCHDGMCDGKQPPTPEQDESNIPHFPREVRWTSSKESKFEMGDASWEKSGLDQSDGSGGPANLQGT